MTEEPELKHLIGVYHHQDMNVLYGSAEGALLQYIRDDPVEDVHKAIKEIDEILSGPMTEDQIDDLLSKYGSEYNYLYKWPSARAWLSHVRKRLAEHILSR